ncbi:SCO family protein, partial [Microvirga sp. 3-52]|nr:SCO family protein [Microvirga sp. 3-52]
MHKFFRTSFIVLIVLILGACSGNEFKPDHKLKIEPFAFTNQHNEEVSLDDLKGQVWLAQFVFSNCTT